MKFLDFFNKTRNRKTNQISYHLKSKQLKKLGLTPEEFEELMNLKPKVKFYKK